ncbi:ABC transporter ATP-binding protein [Falsiroseomonas sp. E2-1-a20]|uniref:ABC transporter ATP-binding protein n=1 Tax=Falsiroseomonas sp. E2-1-a20 TaxID=3239300 RepID=UPI003F35011A
MNTAEPLLSVRDLRIAFDTARGRVVAVDGVSFDVAAGETLGIVGESGCGKSVTALSILRLAGRGARILSGSIHLGGRDLLKLSDRDIRDVRGGEVGMVFQEPMTSLNPVFTVGDQIAEPLMRHRDLSRRAALDRAAELLDTVGIPMARARLGSYPHEMSGGMRQRVMIAMALSCQPKLLIADEPTTALDVTVQAQILELLAGLQQEFSTAVMLITHDLGLVAEFAQRAVVMYAGRIVEQADVATLFRQPLHPYAEGLLASIPPMDEDVERLRAIEGTVPSPHAMPDGCRFAPRCPQAQAECVAVDPPLIPFPGDHGAACIAHTGYRVPAPGAVTQLPAGARP